MYEKKTSPLISREAFRRRLLIHLLVALLLFITVLAMGISGHVYFDGMDIASALVASTTLISGSGLSLMPTTTAGKIFASFYAVVSGYLYIITSSIVLAPLLHRLLHKFHLAD